MDSHLNRHYDIQPIYGPTNPSPQEFARMRVKQFASVSGLDPEREQYYRILQSGVWTPVLKRMRESNIENFPLYITEIEGKKYLFSYFECNGFQLISISMEI